MARSRFLSILAHRRRSSKRSSSSKKDVASTALASDEFDMIRSQEELLNLLNNFPNSESDRKVGISSKKSLVVSFLVSSSPEKPGKLGGKTEQQCKEATEAKENKACRISRSSFGTGRVGVLLNFHVPVPSRDHRRRSPVVREIPCTTLAGIEKREIEHRKSGWWSALLRRKQDHGEQLPPEAVPVPQLTYRIPESL